MKRIKKILGLAALVTSLAVGGCNCRDDSGNMDRYDICSEFRNGLIERPAEICGDGKDNSCDNIPENGCDLDGDGYIATGNEIAPCDVYNNLETSLYPGTYADCTDENWQPVFDCKDENPAINPGMIEVCLQDINGHGYDDNCDGKTDDTFPGKGEVCWEDIINGENVSLDQSLDGIGICQHGYIDCRRGKPVCAGLVTREEVEICDGKDNTCDGLVDHTINEYGFEIPAEIDENGIECFHKWKCAEHIDICNIDETGEEICLRECVSWNLTEFNPEDYIFDANSACKVGYLGCPISCDSGDVPTPETCQPGVIGTDGRCHGVQLPKPTEDCCTPKDDNCNGDVNDGCDQDGDGFSDCMGDCDDNDYFTGPGRADLFCDGIDQDCSGEDLCPEPPESSTVNVEPDLEILVITDCSIPNLEEIEEQVSETDVSCVQHSKIHFSTIRVSGRTSSGPEKVRTSVNAEEFRDNYANDIPNGCTMPAYTLDALADAACADSNVAYENIICQQINLDSSYSDSVWSYQGNTAKRRIILITYNPAKTKRDKIVDIQENGQLVERELNPQDVANLLLQAHIKVDFYVPEGLAHDGTIVNEQGESRQGYGAMTSRAINNFYDLNDFSSSTGDSILENYCIYNTFGEDNSRDE